MCDCTLKEKDEHSQRLTTTTTIFKTCTDLSVQRTDYGSGNTAIVPSEKQFEFCETAVSTKSSSSECSTHSTDELANLQKCRIDCEDRRYDLCLCSDETSDKKSDLECTLAIINLEAIEDLNAIENVINSEGFEIQKRKCFRITREQASELYSGKYESTDFTDFVTDMTSGPLIVLVLARKQAIQKWQLLMGPAKVAEARIYFPDCIRAQQGRKSANCKHFIFGSATREDAEREIRFFFPEFISEPLLSEQNAEDYLREMLCSVLSNGLAQCCKKKPAEPILWLANWLLSNNPNKPKQTIQDNFE